MPMMTRMAADLVGAGLAVEYVPGWQTRGVSSFAPAGVVCHWTAGPRGTVGRPSLNVVTHGRAGIPGPLCNVYLDRGGVAVIVAAGRANHAGLGGARGLVGNSAVYGIEAESAGNGDWTDAQRVAYPRLVAALLKGLGRDGSRAVGHNEWAPSRKIDIRDWPMDAMRHQVATILAGGTVTVSNAAGPVLGPPAGPRVLMLRSPYMTGPDVVAWQQTLAGLGHGVTADGDYGPATDAATKAFQVAVGLIPDGDVGPITRAAARRGGAQAPAPAPAAPAKPVRDVGQTQATQRALHITADGDWGQGTEQAVELVRHAINGRYPHGVAATQRVVGTDPDAVWGRKSAAALTGTVAALQRAWGTSGDGIWGPATEAAWQAARARNLMNW